MTTRDEGREPVNDIRFAHGAPRCVAETTDRRCWRELRRSGLGNLRPGRTLSALAEGRGRLTGERPERAIEARLGVEAGVERDLEQVAVGVRVRQLGDD